MSNLFVLLLLGGLDMFISKYWIGFKTFKQVTHSCAYEITWYDIQTLLVSLLCFVILLLKCLILIKLMLFLLVICVKVIDCWTSTFPRKTSIVFHF